MVKFIDKLIVIFVKCLLFSIVESDYTLYIEVNSLAYSGSNSINYVILTGNLGVSPLTYINTFPNGTINTSILAAGNLVIVQNKFPIDHGFINKITIGNYGDSLIMRSINVYDNIRSIWYNLTFIYPEGYIYMSTSNDYYYISNGEWTSWSVWGNCSASCGNGTSVRQRACTNPPPINGGKPCNSTNNQTQTCFLKSCPVNGGWCSWGEWSPCSITCGNNATTTSLRNCNCPTPQFNGQTCSGLPIQSKLCNVSVTCPGGFEDEFVTIDLFNGTITMLLNNITELEDTIAKQEVKIQNLLNKLSFVVQWGRKADKDISSLKCHPTHCMNQAKIIHNQFL